MNRWLSGGGSKNEGAKVSYGMLITKAPLSTTEWQAIPK